MGTSTSHPSPDRPAWNGVRRALADQDIPPARVVNELWTVAIRDCDAPLVDQLSSATVYELARLARLCSSPMEASRAAVRAVVTAKANSIIVELAKRALLSSFQSSGDRVKAYTCGLFAEITDYISARDVAGLISNSGRLKSIDSAIAFKAELKSLARKEAEGIQVSVESPEAWKQYVTQVTHALTGGRA